MCRLQLISIRVCLLIVLKAIRVNACRTLWFPWITKYTTRVKGNLITSVKLCAYKVNVCAWNKKQYTTVKMQTSSLLLLILGVGKENEVLYFVLET